MIDRTTENKIDLLTVRERQVGELAASGLQNKEITQELNISLYTVKTHVSKVYMKLGIKGRVDLVKIFFK